MEPSERGTQPWLSGLSTVFYPKLTPRAAAESCKKKCQSLIVSAAECMSIKVQETNGSP